MIVTVRSARPSAIWVASLVLAAWLPGTARAQDAGHGLRIAIVDLQKALTTSKEGKATKSRLEGEVNKAQTQLDQMSKDLQKLKDDLDKQRLTLKDDALGEKQRELESKQREAVRYRSDVLDELKRKESEATQRILKALADLVEKMGKEEGYSLVLEQHNFLYADGVFDVTDKLIQRFDAEGMPAAPPASKGDSAAKPSKP